MTKVLANNVAEAFRQAVMYRERAEKAEASVALLREVIGHPGVQQTLDLQQHIRDLERERDQALSRANAAEVMLVKRTQEHDSLFARVEILEKIREAAASVASEQYMPETLACYSMGVELIKRLEDYDKDSAK